MTPNDAAVADLIGCETPAVTMTTSWRVVLTRRSDELSTSAPNA